MKNIYPLLKENPLFEGVTEPEYNHIINCIASHLASYDEMTLLYSKSDMLTSIGIILEGKVILSRETSDGKRSILANLEKNDMFGEAIVFSKQKELPHDIWVSPNSEILFLNPDFFFSNCGNHCGFLETHQKISQNMLMFISDKLLYLNRRIYVLSAPSLKSKIARFLLALPRTNHPPEVRLPMNREELADFLNVARPSLSRELTKLEKENILSVHKNKIVIKNDEALYKLSE